MSNSDSGPSDLSSDIMQSTMWAGDLCGDIMADTDSAFHGTPSSASLSDTGPAPLTTISTNGGAGAPGAKQKMCEPARLSVVLSNQAGDADQVTHSPGDRSSQHLQDARPQMGLISHLPLVAPIILSDLTK